MHEHHRDGPGKLEVGLPYMLEHNRQHVEDVRKWIHRAQEAGLWKVADDLQKVLSLSQRISEHLERAVSKVSSVA
jgi:hypothetical protein